MKIDFLVTTLIAGCGVTAALGRQPDGRMEAKLLAKVQLAAQHAMEDYTYVDMDHDGACELIGVYRDENDRWQTWYCDSSGQACVVEEQSGQPMVSDECTIETVDVGEETHVVLNCWNMMGDWKNFSVLALRDQEICFLLLQQYGYMWMNEGGEILLDVEAYDAAYDCGTEMMMGHTWKDTYLFYDGSAYKEYIASEIPEETFLTYQNAQELKDQIEKQLRQEDTVSMVYTYFRRENGIMHIQCDVENTFGSVDYGYYTVRYEGNVLPKEAGIYNPGRMQSSLTYLSSDIEAAR